MLKGCFGLVITVLAIVGAFALLNADPALPDQAARVWTSVTTAAGHLTHPATPAPRVAVVTPAPSAPPSPPTSAPIVVVAGNPWTIFDCAYAVDTLTEDSHLDASAYSRGLSPPSDPYFYARIATQWATDAGYAREQCGHPRGTLTGDELTAPLEQFAVARLTHVADITTEPQNAAWDRQWITAYDRLTALWERLSG